MESQKQVMRVSRIQVWSDLIENILEIKSLKLKIHKKKQAALYLYSKFEML